MVHYELVKITIDTPNLAEVILDLIVQHYLWLTQLNCEQLGLGFHLKVLVISMLLLGVELKQRLFTTFHPETGGQTER